MSAPRWDLLAPWAPQRIVAFDTETTGTNAQVDHIVEIGITVFEDGDVVDRWSQLVNPGVPLPAITTQITGIKPEDVADAPAFAEVVERTLDLLGSGVLLIYNADFDIGMLRGELGRLGRSFDVPPVIDPFPFCWEYLRESGLTKNAQLGTCAEFLGVPLDEAHRAAHDAEAAARVMFALRDYGDMPPRLGDLLGLQATLDQRVKERFARFRGRRAGPGDGRSVFAQADANAPIELGSSWLYGDEPDPIRALYSRLPDARDAAPTTDTPSTPST